MERFRVHVLTRVDPRIAGDHVHGYLPADLPGQPFGDRAHLIDHTVQMLDQPGGAGTLISTATDPSRFFDALNSAAPGMTGHGLGLERWDVDFGAVYGHGGLPRGLTNPTTVRPGAHDITVMVATQDSRPLIAYGPTLEALAMAVCGNGSQGRHRDTARRKGL
ncbi:MAG TPA: hypothetical protein VLM79_12040 [Kofleriaceae bacterium]|nr:hypothetical protein [Kofleriaceae bacterium]